MKYCSECGRPVNVQRPDGAPARYVCSSCGAVFFQSPRLAVACIAEWENQVLLCRRAVDPGYGLWTLPAGFIESNETGMKGVIRETLEEAGVVVEVGRPYALFHIPHVNQAHIVFLARLLDTNFRAGTESLDVRLFGQEEVPWDALAFATTREALRHYFRDRQDGEICGFHFADIVPVESWPGALL